MLAVAVVLLLVLACVYAWQVRKGLSECDEETLWEPVRAWSVCLGSHEKPGESFASHVELSSGNGGVRALGFRMLGETDVLEVSWEASGVEASSILNERRLVLESRSDGAGSGADVAGGLLTGRFMVLKSEGELRVCRDGVMVLNIPLPRQTWRAIQWLSEGTCDAKPSYQKIGPLYFADNFMHTEGQLGEWKVASGNWNVHSLVTPVRSANPFSFIGKGDGAEATAGFWFWHEYRLACSIQPLQNGAFGLRICRDARNSYNLEWVPEKGGMLRLSRTGHRTESLAPVSIPMPLTATAWYRVDFSCVCGLLRVCVDGNEVIRAVDTAPLPSGGISLLAEGDGAVFDDVVVEPVDSVTLPVPDEADVAPFAAVSSAKFTASGRPMSRSELRFLGLDAANGELAFTLEALEEGESVIMMARQAAGEHLEATLRRLPEGALASICIREAGDIRTLAEAQCQLPDAPLRLAFTVVNCEATLSCNGRTLCLARTGRTWRGGAAVALERPDGAVRPGQDCVCCPASSVSVYATSCARAVGLEGLSHLSWSVAEPLPDIATRVATFSHERSMQNWNDPIREWCPAVGVPNVDYWHRSDFWGDLRLEMSTAGFGGILTRYGLALGGTSGGATTASALLIHDTKTGRLVLTVGGEERVIEIQRASACRSLGLERRGDRLLARLNGDLAWNLPLPDALSGLVVAGRCGRGATRAWAESVSVSAAGVNIELFDKAPSSWIPASGTWDITNRWQCDPRWSFFSGVNLDGAACIWNKRIHGDNITLDFFAGPKMDRARGKAYEYAADFNLVLAADGADIASGYSIMLGGWDDRGTQIVRNGKILAENRDIIIPRRSAIHHRWFHIKARKQGGLLSVWVDGVLAASAVDPKPLKGTRFGIWTWHNGMMVAQLRYSTPDGPMVAPGDPVNPKPKTPYDMATQ